MTINGGALYTNDPDVTLSVIAPNWAKTLRVANDGGFRAARTLPGLETRSAGVSRSQAPSGCPRRSTCASAMTLRRSRTTSSSTRPTPTVSSATLASSSSAATSTAVASAASSPARRPTWCDCAPRTRRPVSPSCSSRTIAAARLRFASSSATAATRARARRSTFASRTGPATSAAGVPFAKRPGRRSMPSVSVGTAKDQKRYYMGMPGRAFSSREPSSSPGPTLPHRTGAPAVFEGEQPARWERGAGISNLLSLLWILISGPNDARDDESHKSRVSTIFARLSSWPTRGSPRRDPGTPPTTLGYDAPRCSAGARMLA